MVLGCQEKACIHIKGIENLAEFLPYMCELRNIAKPQ